MAGMGYASGLIDGLDLAYELAQDHATLEDLVKDLDETRDRHRTRWIRQRWGFDRKVQNGGEP